MILRNSVKCFFTIVTGQVRLLRNQGWSSQLSQLVHIQTSHNVLYYCGDHIIHHINQVTFDSASRCS